MKCYILDALGCPECRKNLHLKIFQNGDAAISKPLSGEDNPYCKSWCGRHGVNLSVDSTGSGECESCLKAEVMEGILECSCGAWYPVIGGVPRLLPTELRHTLIDYYPHFFNRFKKILPPLREREKTDLNKAIEVKGKEKTIDRFSYEWNEFKDYEDDNFSIGIGALEKKFFEGKRVLDAGCGAGRHSKDALTQGAREVFAMDLSNAVDAAFQNTLDQPEIHVIQGDMFHLPFQPEALDVIYSLWALPHTNDPPNAFQSMVPYLNRDGTIIVYLYNDGRPFSYAVLSMMRKITTRLPNPVVRMLGLMIGFVDYVFLIRPYEKLVGWPSLKDTLVMITPSHIKLYSNRSFKTCCTDWMDRLFYPYVHYYSPSDVNGWIEKAKLTKPSIRTLGDYGLIVHGTRQT